jgi:transcriptional regulator with XRE-family HTH domain
LREHRGWTGRELARRAGISNTYVANIEAGAENVRPPIWAALASVFGWPDWKAMLASEALEPPRASAGSGQGDGRAVLLALRDLIDQLTKDGSANVKSGSWDAGSSATVDPDSVAALAAVSSGLVGGGGAGRLSPFVAAALRSP